MATTSETGITVSEAMRGFTNGDLSLLSDETPETIYEQYESISGQEPFFTVEELARWMEENL